MKKFLAVLSAIALQSSLLVNVFACVPENTLDLESYALSASREFSQEYDGSYDFKPLANAPDKSQGFIAKNLRVNNFSPDEDNWFSHYILKKFNLFLKQRFADKPYNVALYNIGKSLDSLNIDNNIFEYDPTAKINLSAVTSINYRLEVSMGKLEASTSATMELGMKFFPTSEKDFSIDGINEDINRWNKQQTEEEYVVKIPKLKNYLTEKAKKSLADGNLPNDGKPANDLINIRKNGEVNDDIYFNDYFDINKDFRNLLFARHNNDPNSEEKIINISEDNMFYMVYNQMFNVPAGVSATFIANADPTKIGKIKLEFSFGYIGYQNNKGTSPKISLLVEPAN